MRTLSVFSRPVRSTLTALAVAAGALVASAQPAPALVFGTFAGPTPEAQSVVRLVINKGGVTETACTGTAIAPTWVLTAGHCTDDAHGGTVIVGQGADTQRLGIKSVQRSPHGDVAVVKVDRDLGLGFYPPVRFSTPAPGTHATVYGWSTWGMGITGYVPTAAVTVQKCPIDIQQCLSGQHILSQAQLPAFLQSGDSGGPMFVDGGVVGVMSTFTSFDARPAELTGMYFHSRLQAHQQWLQDTLGF